MQVLAGAWVRAGAFGVFFESGKDEPRYAEILSACDDDPNYFRCKVKTEKTAFETVDVHRTNFVYELTRQQYAVAWHHGFPSHPCRMQAIANIVAGGRA